MSIIIYAVEKTPDSNLPQPEAVTDRIAGKVLQTPVEVYRCPSDPTSEINPMRGDYGTSNYSGNHGNLSLPRWTTGRAIGVLARPDGDAPESQWHHVLEFENQNCRHH